MIRNHNHDFQVALLPFSFKHPFQLPGLCDYSSYSLKQNPETSSYVQKIKIWDILSLCFQIKVSMHCYPRFWKSAFISLLKENCLMQHFWLVLYSLSTLHISSQSPHVYEVSPRYTYVESLLEFPFHIMSHGFIVIFNILPCYLFFNHFRHMNHNHHYPHFPVLSISSFIHVKNYLIHSCASVIKIFILQTTHYLISIY